MIIHYRVQDVEELYGAIDLASFYSSPCEVLDSQL